MISSDSANYATDWTNIDKNVRKWKDKTTSMVKIRQKRTNSIKLQTNCTKQFRGFML